MMDRRTLSSEREYEDNARVVPRLQLCYQTSIASWHRCVPVTLGLLQLDYETSIASWHRGVPVTLGLSKVVPWLRRLVCCL